MRKIKLSIIERGMHKVYEEIYKILNDLINMEIIIYFETKFKGIKTKV